MRRSGSDEMAHRSHEPGCANGVGVAQRPASERRESGAHDHGKIYVRRVGDNLFLQTVRSFVDHEENHALLKFFPRDCAGFLALNISGNLRIWFRFLRFFVEIKSAAALTAEQA